MSVALLAISSFGTLLMLSSSTVLPEKSSIGIILVVQELHFVIQDCVEWRLGGGGGGGRVEVGAQNSVLSAVLPKQQSLAAIELHGLLYLSSTNFILPLQFLIGFYLVNLVGNVKMH